MAGPASIPKWPGERPPKVKKPMDANSHNLLLSGKPLELYSDSGQYVCDMLVTELVTSAEYSGCLKMDVRGIIYG